MQSATTNTPQNLGDNSVLASLRALLPNRRLNFLEALTIAELQAQRLLALSGIDYPPVPVAIICELPKIILEHDPLLPRQAASGVSHWDVARHAWVISLNPDEPRTRQRFSVAHEYKHIIDHGHPGLDRRQSPRTIRGLAPEEFIAEYFAGCVLLPRPILRAAYCDGIQRPADLAQLFDVSVRAVEVRLAQLGLVEPTAVAPIRTRTATFRRQSPKRTARYYRPLSTSWRPSERRPQREVVAA